jgi:hypothetical protein
MKLIILLFIGMIPLLEARLKCGWIVPSCVPLLDDGKCPDNILCPAGLRRKPVDEKCCCVARISRSEEQSKIKSANQKVLKFFSLADEV